MNPATLWQEYGSLTYEDLPPDVIKVANQCILDWFGCALAGSAEPLAQLLREEFGHRQGKCAVIGAKLSLEARTAALLNGASGHALDYDDTGASVGCHSTAPVFPAALAVAEEIGTSGKALITAFVVGVEMQGRVHQAMGSNHYGLGWHTTATYGTFGATAAAAHLLGLDAEAFGRAWGLAASHASGVKANFGTMTKPYHAGFAAEKGINCASLARRGFTANPDAVSGNQGFIQAASNGKSVQASGGDWLILGTLFKYHAACHLTHAAIESVCQLRAKLAPADLSALTITVHPLLLDVCGIEEPKTGLEGKFSLRGTAALALAGFDTADPNAFVDETIGSAQIQELIGKVTVATDKSLASMQAQVAWMDKSQTRHECEWDVGVPAKDLDGQGDRLARKFQSLCRFAGCEPAPLAARLNSLAEAGSVSLSA
ncbi:MAG: MmgE/PrpD family protein [Pseudomonadales bacterium]